jgi:ribose/xylose/arabinose/galactoside ABC-type transport system permease subunit
LFSRFMTLARGNRSQVASMGIIVGSLTLLEVDVYWNTFVIGATLLVAVLIDKLGRRRRKLE